MLITSPQPRHALASSQLNSSSTPKHQDKDQENREEDKVSLGRKAAGWTLGSLAGAAGAVKGGFQGLARGRKLIPGTTVEGAKLGTKILKPLGRVAGGTVAAAVTGVTGVVGGVASVVGAVGGFIGGTAVTGLRAAGASVRPAATAGARFGATAGSAILGAVGGVVGAVAGLLTLPTILYPPLGLRVIPMAVRAGAVGGFRAGTVAGRYVGGAVGGLAGGLGGGLVALGAALPTGVRVGARAGAQGARVIRAVPRVARGAWKAGMKGGDLAAAAVGGTIGGTLGLAGGVVATAGTGLGGATLEGLRWGVRTYDAVTHPDG